MSRRYQYLWFTLVIFFLVTGSSFIRHVVQLSYVPGRTTSTPKSTCLHFPRIARRPLDFPKWAFDLLVAISLPTLKVYAILNLFPTRWDIASLFQGRESCSSDSHGENGFSKSSVITGHDTKEAKQGCNQTTTQDFFFLGGNLKSVKYVIIENYFLLGFIPK